MIHSKISSPCTPQRRKRQASSGKTLAGSAKTRSINNEFIQIEQDDPVPLRYFDLYKQEKSKAEMGPMFRIRKTYPIAPDSLIPNSTCRNVFKKKEVKPAEVKLFQLRLDILNNLPPIDKNNNWDDDDDFQDLDDPDTLPKSINTKKSKGSMITRQKETKTDVLKRIQNEPWWKKPKEDKPNLRTILLYLIEVLVSKQNDSYESVCYYIIEIFRGHTIEPSLLNQILVTLLENLLKDRNDRLDQCTVRTIAQFMIERKDIIVRLLEFTSKCQTNKGLLRETMNSIKFISDINDPDSIDFILNNMPLVYNAPEENFSLKIIINSSGYVSKMTSNGFNQDADENTHPLLKKISEERWFPKKNMPITLDSVLDAIIEKLSNPTKTLMKTLPVHLTQLDLQIGFSREQFDRVTNSLISILSNEDADYRLIAATSLANLGQETKAIDLALLNSFINDSRVLVRTECGDSLKKLTGITSDVVLKDCAESLLHLEGLPEDNFSLQNYLTEQKHVATQPESSSMIIEENIPIDSISRTKANEQIESEQLSNVNNNAEIQADSNPLATTPTMISSSAHFKEPIRVEINEKKPVLLPEIPVLERNNSKHSSLLPNNREMWDSYGKQNQNMKEKDNRDVQLDFVKLQDNQDDMKDPIYKMLEEHQKNLGIYRLRPNRPILIPHKICMEDIFSDISHLITNDTEIETELFMKNTMKLSDYDNNQHYLSKVESVQLLSSLIIRTVQIHRQYEKFIPGSASIEFTDVLTISQLPLHTSSNFRHNYLNTSFKLPPISQGRITERQLYRMQSNIQTKALRDGLNINKAQSMEAALSHLLKSHREQEPLSSKLKQNDVTHGWLLIELLKAHGITNSERYVDKIIQSYPKFIPLFYGKLPEYLIPVIWNDEVIQQIISIITNTSNISIVETKLVKSKSTKSTTPSLDDEDLLNEYEYSTIVHREDQKKKFLPPIRGTKLSLPRHVLKFGFREINSDVNESIATSPHEESRSVSRRRRVYMHIMMPANGSPRERRESTRSQCQDTTKPDSHTVSFVPIVARPPLYQ